MAPAPSPTPSPSTDDELYTDDTRPLSSIPLPVQYAVAFACTAVVVFIIVLGCCLAKAQCRWHARLNAWADKLERKDAARRRLEAERARREAREGEASPLNRGRFAALCALIAPVSNDDAVKEPAVLARQGYLMVWKGFATRARQKTLGTYFGYPALVWFLMWLLYATFNDKRSTGDMEQYLAALSFVFVLQSTASALAADKALKLRESLRAMGLRDSAYWTGTLVVDGLCLATGLAVVLTCVAAPCRLMHNAGRGYNEGLGLRGVLELFGLFQAAAAALVSLACALSTLCGSAPAASQLAFAATIGSVVAFVVVKITQPAALGDDYVDLWLLFPMTAVEVAMLGTSSTLARAPAFSFSIDLPKVIGWLWFDCVLWGVLAWYLGEVLPSEFGVRKPWHFPVSEAYAYLKKAPPTAPEDYEPLHEDEEDRVAEGDTAVEFANLAKTFGSFKAVDGAALRLPHGRLTALLGHNGAGKTTLLRMLTGLLPPDRGAGAATAYAKDLLKRSGRGAKALLGVVPQHDVLWEHLTVREHAHLCAVLKSGGYAACEGADELIKTFHLDHRKAHFGSELSGGMRRKLSTACALAGGSRFVVLDEPTTGLDPLARKELWEVLEQEKKDRCLLLTTHYMDEADVLGDVVAIMVAGKLVCADAPDVLKNELGWGAKLVVEAAAEAPARSVSSDGAAAGVELPAKEKVPDDDLLARVADVVKAKAPGARAWERRFEEDDDVSKAQRVISRNTGRLEFALPRGQPAAPCLEALEALKPAVRLGVAGTDLEDVFLKVGDEEERRRAAAPRAASVVAAAAGVDESGFIVVARQARALVRKRLRVAGHDPFKTLLVVALPVGAAIAAFACNATDQFGARGGFGANMTTSVICMLGFVPLVGLVAEHVAAERSSKLRNVLTVAGCDARAYWAGTLLGDLALLAVVALCFSCVATLAGAFAGAYKPKNVLLSYKRGWNMSTAIDHTPGWALEAAARQYGPSVRSDTRDMFIDDDAREVVRDSDAWLLDDLLDDPSVVQDAFLRKAADEAVEFFGDPTVGDVLNATGHPVDDDASLTVTERDPEDDGERNGLRRWLKPETWLYPLVFVAQCAAFAYLASFAATGPRTAVVLAPMAVLGLLFVPATVLSLVNLTLGDQGAGLVHLSNDAFLGVLFWGLALCAPHGGFVLETARISTDLAKYASGYPPSAGTWAIAIIETAVFLWVAYRLDVAAAALTVERVDAEVEDLDQWDDDVAKERIRAFDADAAKAHALVLAGVRKCYPGKAGRAETVAVENLSLAVDAGEIFGLLGANGAGKTSAIAVVMRAAFPTAGDATVRGCSVLDDFRGAARHLGVVTQTDTLYDRLSCAEHLDLFLDLRTAGNDVRQDRGAVVRQFLEDVELDHVPDRLAARLSGGMKRKLCVACALVGSPSVVLLDEPSAGLDPVSRRRLWTVLRRAMVGRAVVLTTHSMEEAEALCTRVGVMATGRLKALGTPLRLKAKFGAGWRLALRGADAEAIAARAAELVQGAAAAAARPGRAELVVSGLEGRVGAVFGALERDVAHGELQKLGVEDFRLEQPRLEDVFLRVVRDDAAQRAALEAEAAPVDEEAPEDGIPVARPAADAPGAELARCCCGLDRRAHKFLAWTLSLCALVLWLSMSGLLGEVSYDDDNRHYDDDVAEARGCHHEQGTEPCSVEAVYLNGLPFTIAFVMAVAGCCGCCCCIPKKADAALATAGEE